jgi:hypothetical protein
MFTNRGGKKTFLSFTELKKIIDLPVKDWRSFKKQIGPENIPHTKWKSGRTFFTVIEIKEWLRKKKNAA